MKLSPHTLIAAEKLTQYLLTFQHRGDKSKFLGRAGYNRENHEELDRDLRTQILTMDAIPLENNNYGQLYSITGTLTGPNGVALPVRTIWMKEHLTGITKFITLIPEK